MLYAYDEGWDDFMDGYYWEDNPFYEYTKAEYNWDCGWLDARDYYYGYEYESYC